MTNTCDLGVVGLVVGVVGHHLPCAHTFWAIVLLLSGGNNRLEMKLGGGQRRGRQISTLGVWKCLVISRFTTGLHNVSQPLVCK